MIDTFFYWVGVVVTVASSAAVTVFIVGRTIEYALEKFDLTMKFVYFVGDIRRKRGDH